MSALLASCKHEFDGKDGWKIVHFPNSDAVKQEVEYRNGKRIGEFKEYYRNGNLMVRQFYKDDRLDDSAFYYYENGTLKQTQYLKNYKKEGTWKKYNEQGKVYEEFNFRDDEQDGPTTKYTYRTGRVLEKWNYSHGMKEGKQELYYNNGKPKAFLYFHRNRPCVGTEEWEDNGDKINNDIKVTTYEKNSLLLENTLQLFVKVENPQENDEAWIIDESEPENYATQMYPLKEEKPGLFVREYRVGQGGFVLEKFKVAVYRQTAMGNTVIKIVPVTISANNY